MWMTTESLEGLFQCKSKISSYITYSYCDKILGNSLSDLCFLVLLISLWLREWHECCRVSLILSLFSDYWWEIHEEDHVCITWLNVMVEVFLCNSFQLDVWNKENNKWHYCRCYYVSSILLGRNKIAAYMIQGEFLRIKGFF